MAERITFETQFKILGADGTTYYVGAAKIMNEMEITSQEASATMLAAEAIINSPTNTIIASPTATAAVTEIVKAVRSVNAASVAYLGVTMDPILAGKQGTVAGVGSLVPVRTNGTATAGTLLVASSTAAQVTDAATKSATVPAYGTVLGTCMKANASVGSVNVAGVLVVPQ